MSGGAFAPLDASYPEDRLRFMLQNLAAPVVVTQPHLRPSLPAHASAVICRGSDLDAACDDGADAPSGAVDPESLAYSIPPPDPRGRRRAP